MDTWQLHLPKSAISDKLWLVFPKEYGMVYTCTATVVVEKWWRRL